MPLSFPVATALVDLRLPALPFCAELILDLVAFVFLAPVLVAMAAVAREVGGFLFPGNPTLRVVIRGLAGIDGLKL